MCRPANIWLEKANIVFDQMINIKIANYITSVYIVNVQYNLS